ncbi:MAG: sigma factor [Minwuia sp.]|nr:sigma factor [Minwuia sp.]
MTAILLGRFGPAAVDDVEDIVQESLLRACRTWPWKGIPDNPAGWLWRVAERLALDRMRRSGRTESDALLCDVGDGRLPVDLLVADEELRLLFLCCDPVNGPETSVPLTLRLACGFSTREIAAALLLDEATAAQRISRGKARLRKLGSVEITALPGGDVAERLHPVLNTLYLLFNGGYGGNDQIRWIREELCVEATRLCILLTGHSRTAAPEVLALAALFHLLTARLPARQFHGDLVDLEFQDRGLWDRRLISSGLRYLEKSRGNAAPTAWHLLAGIAAEHARATHWPDTDWPSILAYYDQLVVMSNDPVVALNRSVAVAQVSGPAAGLAAVPEGAALQDYHLFHATRARYLRDLGRSTAANAAIDLAIELAPNDAVRRHLMKYRTPLQS